MAKNILFVWGLGSEVRQFLHSGVISGLVKLNHKVFISSKMDVKSELDKYAIPITNLPYYGTSVSNKLLGYLQKLIDEAFVKRFNVNVWTFSENKQKKTDSIFLNFLISLASRKYIYSLLLKLECLISMQVKNYDWEHIITSNGINTVIVNVANNLPAPIIATNRLGIQSVLLYHTNKDILAQGRLHFKFTKIGVWNQQMKKDLLLYNPILQNGNIDIIGCSHFCYLTQELSVLQDDNSMVKEQNTFNILYFAAGEGVIINEYEYIRDIQHALDVLGVTEYIITIRVNPMDTGEYWSRIADEKIVVNFPRWKYNRVLFYNYTLKEDLIEFGYLLQKTNLCISIPSSTVVEASIMSKPMLFLCYTPQQVRINKDIMNYWNARFNKEVRDTNVCYPVFSYQNLEDAVCRVKNEGIDKTREMKQFLSEIITYPIEDILLKNITLIDNL